MTGQPLRPDYNPCAEAHAFGNCKAAYQSAEKFRAEALELMRSPYSVDHADPQIANLLAAAGVQAQLATAHATLCLTAATLRITSGTSTRTVR
jgi:uncharacterized protein YchJ